MKKSAVIFTIVSLLVACQKPEVSEQVLSDKFCASVETYNVNTKTSMNAEMQIVWSEGDCISLFRGCTLADKYQVLESSVGQSNAEFVFVEDEGDSFYAGTELSCNVAFYPYSKELSLSGPVFGDEGTAYKLTNVVLPQTQVYSENSFANESFLMAAVTDTQKDRNLKFKNILGATKLQLKGTQVVKSVRIEGANGEKLSGAATVTAYANNQAPAINMSDAAGVEVILDCGDGVLLNETDETDFYITLPPVLFEKGFVVTITDTAERVYVLSADVANTILRSGLLIMPVINLNGSGVGGDSEDDEEELYIPVSYVNLDYASLNLYKGRNAQLTAKVGPRDATDKIVVWSSSNASVAVVDQTGLVTAVAAGDAIISATAGGKIAKCTVSVSNIAVANVDYVDEYGVNHGKGTAVGMAVWAPVNCGYHETDYKWGKLYQWGRKYGQGYSGPLYDSSGNEIGKTSDATAPEFEEGGVSEISGNHKSNANVFYVDLFDWVDPSNDQLWNIGSESSPVKTANDPCPAGWRVPTNTELCELQQNRFWTLKDEEYAGFWFSGPIPYSDDAQKVFLPAAGHRYHLEEDARSRGFMGNYWTSTPAERENAYYVDYYYGGVFINNFNSRALGHSVRCVQE